MFTVKYRLLCCIYMGYCHTDSPMFLRSIQRGIIQVSKFQQKPLCSSFPFLIITSQNRPHFPFPTQERANLFDSYLPTPIAASSSALAASPIPPATSPPASPNRRLLPRLSPASPSSLPPARDLHGELPCTILSSSGILGTSRGAGFWYPVARVLQT